MNTKTMIQKSATVAVINQDKKILILERGPTAPWAANRYCLPGGKVEPNEKLVEAAARELDEETGIFIANHKDLVSYTIPYSFGYSKIVFVIIMDDPVVALNWEHDSYVWVSLETSSRYDLVPGTKATIKVLGGRGLVI